MSFIYCFLVIYIINFFIKIIVIQRSFLFKKRVSYFIPRIFTTNYPIVSSILVVAIPFLFSFKKYEVMYWIFHMISIVICLCWHWKTLFPAIKSHILNKNHILSFGINPFHFQTKWINFQISDINSKSPPFPNWFVNVVPNNIIYSYIYFHRSQKISHNITLKQDDSS